MDIIEVTNRTYTLPYIGVYYNDVIIPKDSKMVITEGCYNKDVDFICVNWETPKGKNILQCFSNDFLKELIKNGTLIDISTTQKPKTKPLFKEGDLVKLKISNIDCYKIVIGSKYNYDSNKWLYLVGDYHGYDNFHLDELCYNENELEKVDEVKFDISDNDKKIEMIIKEIK